MISVRLGENGISVAVKALGRVNNPRAILAPVGREGVNQLKSHYRGLDKVRENSLGGKRTHFWNKVANSVHLGEISDLSVRIGIGHPVIKHKIEGGTIRAKRVRNLAIPTDAKSYDRRPKVFEQATGIQLVLALLVRNRQPGLFGKVGGKFKLFYVLQPSVYQKPDPEALPPWDRFRRALGVRAQTVLNRLAQSS